MPWLQTDVSEAVLQCHRHKHHRRKVIPAYEEQFHVKEYLIKGIRGVNKNSFGIVWLFETEQVRNKFFNTDGTNNDLGKAAMEKVNITENELEK